MTASEIGPCIGQGRHEPPVTVNPEAEIADFVCKARGFSGIVDVVHRTVTQSNVPVARIEICKIPNVCRTIRQFPALVKHDGGLVLRGPHIPEEVEYLRAAADSLTDHFLRLRHRREERPRALP